MNRGIIKYYRLYKPIVKTMDAIKIIKLSNRLLKIYSLFFLLLISASLIISGGSSLSPLANELVKTIIILLSSYFLSISINRFYAIILALTPLIDIGISIFHDKPIEPLNIMLSFITLKCLYAVLKYQQFKKNS
ncbi:conserved membrane hypothetical protein [Vibrio chagasii]|nr:conserved membrane hypothetical protein [Vibrio chagasii]